MVFPNVTLLGKGNSNIKAIIGKIANKKSFIFWEVTKEDKHKPTKKHIKIIITSVNPNPKKMSDLFLIFLGLL